MNVLINGVSSKSGGARTYIENLIERLSSEHDGNRYFFYVPSAVAKAGNAKWADHISVIATNIGSAPFWKRFLWDQIHLRAIVKKSKIDVLISSSDFGMTFPPCRQILLVRNSLFFSRLYNKTCSARKSWKSRLNLSARRRMVLLSIRFSKVVVTASRSMLDEMKQFINFGDRRTVVNPFGVPLNYFTGSQRQCADNAEEIGRHHLRLLHVSEYSDYKNLTVLFKAIRLLSEEGFKQFTLLTTADPWQFPTDELVTREEDQFLACHPMVYPFVKIAGGVPYAEIPKLYSTSDVFVFPSIAESFGHPLAEAMASGLPILASDIPVCREICGDAAIYFDPFDEKSLAEAILHLSEDTSLRKSLSKAGRRRAESKFNWSDHVRRLIKLVEEVGADA
jgi:glycosyltransferase involved in cell wall biosynthesis